MLPDHLPFQRSFCLLRRLLIGPADRATLAAYVEDECDPTAYGALRAKAEVKRFENDLQRLRALGVEIEYRNGDYALIRLGAFSPVALDDAGLNTLAFLQETFGPGAPWGEAVQALVQRIVGWLPAPQRESLPARRQRWRIDLQRRDDDPILPELVETIEQAIGQRRLLRFAYRSPGQDDGQPRHHTVQPYRLEYDTTRRHLYLDAYRRQVAGPQGVWRAGQWQRYRLGRILAETVALLPDKFPAVPPKRPRYLLEYWLAPQIARLGEISRHFAETAVHETDEAGWVRVTATTEDLFGAVRLLLSYGPLCRVTGGPAARREMVTLVQQMANLYTAPVEVEDKDTVPI